MPTFIATLDCPHCKTKRASMRSSFVIQDANGVLRTPLSCTHCYELVVALVYSRYDFKEMLSRTDGMLNLQDSGSWLQFQGVLYPNTGISATPKSVPEKIATTFEEAIDNLSRQKFETAVLLCGKALDLATRGMDPTWKLEKRLKTLAADGKITQDMADWAQEIRLDRNTAIHEDHDFDATSAGNIISFTEAFLTYIYTLPAMVAEHRTSRDTAPKAKP